jgi:hypothetical protein
LASNPEQRDKARFKHISPVNYEDLDRGFNASSKMFNYSKEGLYFESDLELPVGERIFIGIENSPYARESGVYECYHAVIRWCKKLDHSMYRFGYGIRYCDPMHGTDAGAGAPRPACDARQTSRPAAPPADDLRRHPRVDVSKTVNCFSRRHPFQGRIKNIGPSGAFIETDEDFAVGEKFAVALPFVNKGKGSLVKAEIVWKNDSGVGVKFKRAKKKQSPSK